MPNKHKKRVRSEVKEVLELLVPKNNRICQKEDSSELSIGTSCAMDDENIDEILTDSSSSAESVSSNYLNDVDIREEIAGWAVKHAITNFAINDLLIILRKSHPSLPKDARTLKQTPRDAPIVLMQGGDYVHCSSIETGNHVVAALQPLLMRLTQEVQSLRTEVQVLRKEVKELKKEKIQETIKVIPENAFTTLDDFLQFEKKLQDDKDFLSSFEKELLTVAKSPNFIKNCWRKIFNDVVAQKLCWKGTEDKKNVRSLSTAKAIRTPIDAAIYMGETEDGYVKSTKAFFQFAKTRQNSREAYQAKPKKTKLN